MKIVLSKLQSKKFKGDAGNLSSYAMATDEKGTILRSEYQGKRYYFCSYSCKKRFDKNPAEFTPICWCHDSLQTS